MNWIRRWWTRDNRRTELLDSPIQKLEREFVAKKTQNKIRMNPQFFCRLVEECNNHGDVPYNGSQWAGVPIEVCWMNDDFVIE